MLKINLLKKEIASCKAIFNQLKVSNSHFKKAQSDLKKELPKAQSTVKELQRSVNFHQENNKFRLDRIQENIEKINKKLK
ncbi:hypothetical protein G7084_04140 [Weissella coleopterorum]|uniref:Uncharacterized protein n=1 Tax=Weissella coleopterorum TaxID=2714949 RepID=A0A6G8AZT4_9LACO|nr:hypothetical protein [Weissella coleopterorum]QIL50574.1 hypothetical protein G7084_04140 [Weissella coleopterorum]